MGINDSSVSDEYINQVVYEGDSIDISHVQMESGRVPLSPMMVVSQSISTARI